MKCLFALVFMIGVFFLGCSNIDSTIENQNKNDILSENASQHSEYRFDGFLSDESEKLTASSENDNSIVGYHVNVQTDSTMPLLVSMVTNDVFKNIQFEAAMAPSISSRKISFSDINKRGKVPELRFLGTVNGCKNYYSIYSDEDVNMLYVFYYLNDTELLVNGAISCKKKVSFSDFEFIKSGKTTLNEIRKSIIAPYYENAYIQPESPDSASSEIFMTEEGCVLVEYIKTEKDIVVKTVIYRENKCIQAVNVNDWPKE